MNALLEYAAMHPPGPGQAYEKTSVSDGSPCDDCLVKNGVTVPLEDAYPDGSTGPPYHYNCECTEELTVVNVGYARQLAMQIIR